MSFGWALVAATPWLLLPPAVILRLRRSRSLEKETASPPAQPPRVSIVVPARNEGRNIGRCVRSILASTYPALELIVVDDQSADRTAAVARDAAANDDRVRVLPNPPLPNGWFGKQWACATGAS